jgi:hypothetical protein
MTHITQIIVDFKTGDAAGADADGPVYLGVGSREFRLAKQGNSFERNQAEQFVLGSTGPGTANVRNPNDNDPLQHIDRIELSDVLGAQAFPTGTSPPTIPQFAPYNVYIRYESNTKFLVEAVTVRLIGAQPISFPTFDVTCRVKNGIQLPGIWLGDDYGKYLYLQPP